MIKRYSGLIRIVFYPILALKSCAHAQRRIGLLVFFHIIFYSSNATVRTYANFTYEHLNLSYCHNYSDQADLEILKYKGYSIILNNRIGELKKEGLLDDRIFEIQVGCKVFGGHPSIEVSRNKRANFIFIHGETDLSYLMNVVEYFRSEEWESFVYDIENVEGSIAKESFYNIMTEKYGLIVVDRFDSVLVWEKNNIKIFLCKDEIHSDEQLVLYDKNGFKHIDFEKVIPVESLGHVMLMKGNRLMVYCEGKEINSIETKELTEFKIEAYPKWFNINERGKAVYSYSIEKKRFYDLR